MRRSTRFALLASLAVLAAPAEATIFIYEAGLTGSQEFPPVASPGTGFTTVTYDDVLHTLRIELTFSDLVGTTTASHIHIRPDELTPTGGVATQVPFFAGFPIGVTEGTYDNTFDLTMLSSWNPAFVTANGGTAAGAESAFIAGLNSGLGYLNVHSTFVGSGEIRGNLQLVPEPATWAMMLLGFGAAGFVIRRQKAAARTPRLA